MFGCFAARRSQRRERDPEREGIDSGRTLDWVSRHPERQLKVSLFLFFIFTFCYLSSLYFIVARFKSECCSCYTWIWLVSFVGFKGLHLCFAWNVYLFLHKILCFMCSLYNMLHCIAWESLDYYNALTVNFSITGDVFHHIFIQLVYLNPRLNVSDYSLPKLLLLCVIHVICYT